MSCVNERAVMGPQITRPRKVGAGVAVLLLCLLAMSAWLWLNGRGQNGSFVVLPFQERTPSKLEVAVDRGWSWIRYHLFGFGRSVLLSATFLNLRNPSDLSDLHLAQPQFSDNGLQVWILESDAIRRLRQRLQELTSAQVVAQPRIQTASGIQGTLFVGQSVPVQGTNQEVGLTVKCLPRIRRDRIDLTSTLLFTELRPNRPDSVWTNLALRSKIQLRKGSGAFLLNTNRTATNVQATGILFEATLR
jgi:hypothetical protein